MSLSSIITEYRDYPISFEGQSVDPRTKACKMYILVNTSVKLSAGKIAAQVGHAVQKTTTRCINTRKWTEYVRSSMPKIVLKIPSEELFASILDQTKHIFKSYVVDEGRTQCPPGTVTAVGYDPLYETEIPSCFNNLKLL